MQNAMWLITAGFLAIGCLVFLMMLAGARHAIVEQAEEEYAQRQQEEEARRQAEAEAELMATDTQEVYEAQSV